MKSKTMGLSKKAGLPPGTLVHIGSANKSRSSMHKFEFSSDFLKEEDDIPLEEAMEDPAPGHEMWLNINGIHETEIIQKLGDKFELHQLLQEDILNSYHRPKFEEFKDHLFVTLKMLGLNGPNNKIISEQVSLVLGSHWILSFQEHKGDLFEPLRSRLRIDGSAIREKEADYIFYRLIDLIVDNYYYVSEHLTEEVEKLEEYVMAHPDKEARVSIQHLKKRISDFRKSVSPLREAIFQIMKSEHPLISAKTQVFIRDVYDHLVHIMDVLDSQREAVAGTLDLYLSGISFKTNQVMQVLTIIATIFIPLTFIAGVYGMNFEVMPELQWRYGYLFVWMVMLGVLLVMLAYFRNKKWL